ncbi:MAG TPA: hypothetical protein ENI63_01965 [Candidatus Kaiserbacteria bacterium]|nr:hypothetical protein [Candidatus Kaiserbacteria bacterium]
MPPCQLPEGYELARLILGDDYITPEEVATFYGFSYTDEQLEHFTDTLPDIQIISWLRANGYMLMAGPPTDLRLLQGRELDNQLFYLSIKVSCAEDKKKFVQYSMVKAGEWLAIRKEAVPNSFYKTWKETAILLTEVEYIPNVTEVIYAVATYRAVRGIYLFRRKFVRTSSADELGHHILVGFYDEDGIEIDIYLNDVCDCSVGIPSARRLTRTLKGF